MLAQPPLGLCLAGRARAQPLGQPLARGAVGGELGLERLDAVGDRGGDVGERRLQTLRGRDERLVGGDQLAQQGDLAAACLALPGSALGHPPLGRELALELRAAHRRRALLRRLAALLDEPPGAPCVLLRGGAGTVCVAQGAIRGLPQPVDLRDPCAGLLGGDARGVLPAGGAL